MGIVSTIAIALARASKARQYATIIRSGIEFAENALPAVEAGAVKTGPQKLRIALQVIGDQWDLLEGAFGSFDEARPNVEKLIAQIVAGWRELQALRGA